MQFITWKLNCAYFHISQMHVSRCAPRYFFKKNISVQISAVYRKDERSTGSDKWYIWSDQMSSSFHWYIYIQFDFKQWGVLWFKHWIVTDKLEMCVKPDLLTHLFTYKDTFMGRSIIMVVSFNWCPILTFTSTWTNFLYLFNISKPLST